MDAKTYYKTYPKDHIEAMAHKAGIVYGSFRQIAFGRRPSVDTAKAIERASNKEMTAVELLGLDI